MSLRKTGASGCGSGRRVEDAIRCPAITPSRQVGLEHDPRLVGDYEFRTRLECDCSRRHPAGPEDRHLVSMILTRMAMASVPGAEHYREIADYVRLHGHASSL